MSYIKIEKSDLINLEYALKKEILRSNQAGGYSSTTIVNCNTRKYHGLFVVPQRQIDEENHLLLSSIDDTVIQHNREFNLGLHMFQGGHYHPKGHKYLEKLELDPIPKHTYRVGGIILSREMIFIRHDERLLIRYTVEEALSPIILRIRPFLAFRNIHKLTFSNIHIDQKYSKVENGVGFRMYPIYSRLFFQFSKDVEYTHVPDWYYNFEYIEERERGYESNEDLYVPGFFELEMKKGEQVVLSIALEEKNSSGFKPLFSREMKVRVPRDNYENCLINAAEQFIIKNKKKTEVIAGFPWFGRWGRDTFISLPGLTLCLGNIRDCKNVLDTMTNECKGALFPNIGQGEDIALNSVDAPLWYFWAVQQYVLFTGDAIGAWNDYSEKMKAILDGFKDGTSFKIKMRSDGLIRAGVPGKALTWMDAVVFGKPSTPRIGCPVEINALWYNAICFSIELAEINNDHDFVSKWQKYPELIRESFNENFWIEEKQYCCDVVNDDGSQDLSVRPNMVFATSLPYSPLSDDKKSAVLTKVESELLTPKGLRTLSPKNLNYKGVYSGDQEARDNAYHQGTVWPWLLGHFCEGLLKVYGKEAAKKVKNIFLSFEVDMVEAGIGTVSEIYDGDPPYRPKGAISQAWSIAELLRIKWLLNQYL
ncbi:MAG: amylo-alpha-1,6-glucosidase [Hyphomicrobiales bacterium]